MTKIAVDLYIMSTAMPGSLHLLLVLGSNVN